MVITTQITQKDKKLIIFLCVFLLIACVGWFIIKPLIEEIGDIDTRYNEQLLLKTENDRRIRLIPEYEAKITASISILAEKKAFFGMLKDHDIDLLFTGMALEYGFMPNELQRLNIEMPSGYSSLTPYLSEQKGNSIELMGIYEASVSFDITGSRDILQPFLDLLCNQNSAIMVKGFQWGEGEEEDSLTVNLRVIMTDNEEYTINAEKLLADGFARADEKTDEN